MFNNTSKNVILIFIFWTFTFAVATMTLNIIYFGDEFKNIALKNASKKLLERETFFNDFLKETKNDMNLISSIIIENDYKNINNIAFLNQFIQSNKLYLNFELLPFESLNNKDIKKNSDIWFSSIFFNQNINRKIFKVYKKIDKNNQSFLLVLKVDFDSFLKSFLNTPLYDMYIFNNKGEVFHSPNNFKVTKISNIDTFFPKNKENLLNYRFNKTEDFVSLKFTTEILTGLNLLLKLKKDYIHEHRNDSLSKAFIFVVLTCLFFGLLFLNISRILKGYFEKINNYQKELMSRSLERVDDYVLYSKTDLKGKITYASGGFCKLTGYTKEELEGKAHNIVRHQDIDKKVFIDMWNTIKCGNVWSGEIKNKKKNGEAYWIKTNVAPDFDENGKHIGYVSIRENITFKRELEEKNKLFQKSLEYNKQLLELSEEGKVITSNQYDIINFNSKMKLMFNHISYSLNFFDFLSMIDEEETEKFKKYINNLNSSKSLEHFIFHSKGMYFKIIIKNINDEQKLIMINDITSIVKQKVYFENILNTSNSIILTTNGIELKSINKRFFDIFDYEDYDDFKSKHNCICELFIKKDDYVVAEKGNINWIKQIQNNENLKSLYENNVCMLDKKGKERVFHIESSGKIFDDNDMELLTLTEITMLVKNKKLIEVQTKQAAMGEMIAMIAHQWRQPLTVLISILTKLNIKYRTDLLTKEEFIEYYDRSTEVVHHLSETINDFKNYFKKDDKNEIITLPELVKKSTRFLDTSLKNLKIDLIEEYKNNTDKISVNISVSIFSQVIINLIKNALDELREKKIDDKYIKIKISETKEFIKIIIRDNAGGIPETIIDKIFEPYFSTKSLNGTGLGLYMSKTIIENNFKGSLTVMNKRCGAEFTIKLPKESYKINQ